MLNHINKLILIILVAITALLLEFIFKFNNAAQILITLTGCYVSITMSIEMIKTLKSGKYGIDLLAVTAVISTLAVGQYWAALIVLIMLTGGDSLEDYAAQKANTELKALLDNSPQNAYKINNNNINNITLISTADVKIGDHLLIKPGNLVPVDGIVLQGSSNFDQSSLTGESQPVFKQPGDQLMSGSINGETAIIMQVTKLAKDSQYQKLVQLVKYAKSSPANFVRLADRYAVPFTLIAYLIAGLAWFLTKNPIRFAEVLVVASPCPLILAAPVALISGMSRASRNGIVVKSGSVLEKLADATTIAFDKTGTLTTGILSIDQITVLDKNYSTNEIMQLIASIEQNSNHILAKACLEYAQNHNLKLINFDNITESVGQGLTVQAKDSTYQLGRLNFVTKQIPNLNLPITKTTIYLSKNHRLIAYISFVDSIRPETKETLQQLKKSGFKKIVMLTGDQSPIAKQVAQKLNITNYYANLLPAEKIKLLKKLQNNNSPVVMVGDGINDAPSLATADIGIALGANGSTAASEASDLVILKNNLLSIPKAVSIAKDTMRVAKQSVLIGIIICIILMLLASFGYIPTLIGAFFQEIIDTVSILWALRARK